MTLSELILEYVAVSHRVEKLISHLELKGIDWRSNQDGIELGETLREYGREFQKHGLHAVALECSLSENRLHKLRITYLSAHTQSQ